MCIFACFVTEQKMFFYCKKLMYVPASVGNGLLNYCTKHLTPIFWTTTKIYFILLILLTNLTVVNQKNFLFYTYYL